MTTVDLSGLELPPVFPPVGSYVSATVHGGVPYTAGHIPLGADGTLVTGRLGNAVDPLVPVVLLDRPHALRRSAGHAGVHEHEALDALGVAERAADADRTAPVLAHDRDAVHGEVVEELLEVVDVVADVVAPVLRRLALAEPVWSGTTNVPKAASALMKWR